MSFREEFYREIISSDKYGNRQYLHQKRLELLRSALFKTIINSIKQLMPVDISVVVDVGGLNGNKLVLLKEAGVNFRKGYVVDINPISTFKDTGIEYLKCDLNVDKIPLPDESADIVLLLDVIEHLENTDHCVEEIYRIIKPEGLLILTTPNLAWYPNLILLALGYQPFFTEVSYRCVFGRPGKSLQGHLRVFTCQSIKEMLMHYGFKIELLKTFPVPYLPKILYFIDSVISKIIRHLGAIILIIARKV